MYGYIYITTNLINGKKYIGQHKAKKRLSKVYKGSGILIKKAFEKYGSENFTCELIEWCNSKEELNDREIFWIDHYNAVEDPNFYNCNCGGQGGNVNDWLAPENLESWKMKIKEDHRIHQKGVRMADRVKDTDKYLENLERKKQNSKLNPLCWYNNGSENIYIKKDQPVPEGFVAGRIQTRVWYTNGVDNIYIDINKQEIPEGYYKGRVMPELVGRTLSEESRAKMRASWDKEKHKLSDEARKIKSEKLSKANKGKPKSKETIEKIKESKRRNKEKQN